MHFCPHCETLLPGRSNLPSVRRRRARPSPGLDRHTARAAHPRAGRFAGASCGVRQPGTHRRPGMAPRVPRAHRQRPSTTP
jgi:hypothetical protein